MERHDTEKVIWICSEDGSLQTVRQQPSMELLADGLIEIRMFDYKGLVRNFCTLHKKLISDIKRRCAPKEPTRFYLWYTYPAFFGLGKLRIWNKVIYDCSDWWCQVKSDETHTWIHNIRNKIIERTENFIVGQADQCFATSTFLLNHLASRHDKVMLIENGVEFHRFDTVNVAKNESCDSPTIGFIGGLKPWKVDFRLLLDLAVSRPKWKLVIAGPVYGESTDELQLLMRQPNVNYIPFVPHDKVPEVIQSFDAGLLPYLENDYNKAVFPLKLFEYLAAGVPVVGCGLPSTLHHVAEHIYHHVPGRTQDFIAACEKLITKRNEHIEIRKALARQADWEQKFEIMWNTVVNAN
jgi:teichuronic acid biosynthesis glycosyltransferase TuaH